MKNRIITFILFGLLFFIGTALSTPAQIVYKIPDGVFPMDWSKSGFKGTLMLDKDSPSGIFIAFPNEGESGDDLRDRAAKFIAPMVVHDTKEKATIPFEVKSITSHKGDIEDRGRYYFFKGEKESVQIIFFEEKPLPLWFYLAILPKKRMMTQKAKSGLVIISRIPSC